MSAMILQANALNLPLADGCVQTCVTSPPYWGLRAYLSNDDPNKKYELGLEPTPDEYVANMVNVFREVKRVLRDDGTLWLNLGDSFFGSWGNYGGQNRGNGTQRDITNGSQVPNPAYDGLEQFRPPTAGKIDGLKPKDLVGIPWRVAFALQADGWYLRSDIIWHKPNPMPESVTDRPTKAHEYIFLLSKSARYYYDAEAVREKSEGVTGGGFSQKYAEQQPAHGAMRLDRPADNGSRNRRTVWTIATAPYSGAHFATFPPKLVEPCILAGTSERGCCPACGAPWERVVERTTMVIDRSDRTHELGRTRASGTMIEPPSATTTGWRPTCACPAHEPVPCLVLDPFNGSGTTGRVAVQHRRRYVGTELNPDYIALAHERTGRVQIEMAV